MTKNDDERRADMVKRLHDPVCWAPVMPEFTSLRSCPICGALVPNNACILVHMTWHEQNNA